MDGVAIEIAERKQGQRVYPYAAPLTHRNDLGRRGSRADDDIGRQTLQSKVRRHIRRSHRWPPLCTAQRAGSGIGANLARMEIKLIFNELADQIPNISKLGEPQRLRSGWLNGVKDLQVSYQG